jgi:hypothetical protein
MRKAVTLIIILVALLAVYWMVESDNSVVTTTQEFIEADSASITKMEIHSAQNDVVLVRESSGWFVEGEKQYPVDDRTLSLAITKFEQMTKKALISERPEKFADLQVDDSSGVKVTVTQGDKVTTLLLGKAGPTFQTSYARIAGSNEIWEISGNHRGSFDRKRDDWRDKKVCDYEMSDFNKFVLTYPDQSFSATLQDSVWHVKSGSNEFDADGKLIERLSRMASRISAVEFADTLAENAFDQPDFHMIADLASGESLDIKLIKDGDEKYFLRKAEALSDFVIYKATAEALMKKPEDFVRKEESK